MLDWLQAEDIIEYGGFVLNTNTDEWECLFVSEISAVLAHNRALEKANECNRLEGYSKYDTSDIWVRQRRRATKVGDWESIEDVVL